MPVSQLLLLTGVLGVLGSQTRPSGLCRCLHVAAACLCLCPFLPL